MQIFTITHEQTGHKLAKSMLNEGHFFLSYYINKVHNSNARE